MSGKGSKRRPGTGYEENWEKIFGHKKAPKDRGKSEGAKVPEGTRGNK